MANEKLPHNGSLIPLLIGLGGLIAALITPLYIFVAGSGQRISEIYVEVKEIRVEFKQHQLSTGHSGVRENSSDIANLDLVLQREMALNDDRIKSDLSNFERRIQEEMKLLNAIQDARWERERVEAR